MAKIYISYSHRDTAEVNRVVEALKLSGHTILMDTEVLKVGQDFRKALLKALRSADGCIVFITENSLKSNYVLTEIGAARAFVEETDNKKFFIPVVYGMQEIPHILQDIYCVLMRDDNFDEALLTIDQTIASFAGRKEAVEQKEDEQREKIKINASAYVDDALKQLQKRETRNSNIAHVWYTVGFISLLAGIWAAITGLENLDKISQTNAWIYVIVILKSIVIVGLLIAASKYAFDLGKAHMNEALRNADRQHAISFGRFYLQAFGDRLGSAEEIKDIFQTWNIDKDSSFQKLDSNNYDPKFVEKLMEVLSNLASKDK
jgi:hypothetical protein